MTLNNELVLIINLFIFISIFNETNFIKCQNEINFKKHKFLYMSYEILFINKLDLKPK